MLDVGCGWGSFVIHAAAGTASARSAITLSEPQAELARERAREAGVADRVEFRVADYRELAGEPFDAIASIGMVEHVGEEQIDVYARRLFGCSRPGGRLLNHGIASSRTSTPRTRAPFSERFVFPDGVPAAALAGARARSSAPASRPRTSRASRGLRDDAHALDRALRRPLGRGGAARGHRARAGLAPLPARRAAGLRDRLGIGLPGAGAPTALTRTARPSIALRVARDFTAAQPLEYGRACPAKPGGRGMSTTVPVRLNVNGVEHHLGGGAAPVAGPRDTRSPGADRHARRLRHVQLRSLHDPHGRPAGEVVHGARGAGRRRGAHDDRGHGRRGRAAPAAGGVLERPRPPVRLLHARA